MKLITLLLATSLVAPLYASENNCNVFKQLNDDQKHNARLSYNRGSGSDLGLTLAAIAMTESSLGVQRVNTRSKDFGLYAININTMKSIAGVDNVILGYLLAFNMTYNDEVAAKYALNVLKHFKKVHKGDWEKMVMAYNAGNNYKRGEYYLQKVKRNVKMLQQCMKLGK
ncbi:transglycosylase [Shewanella sp. phage 1/4]|uniref:hypothetical protein n=1 Tax=Shewanella phage 1/4 TaxID=1458859 RepID=UPI0004F822FD|nr:hypothetical protein S14_202 [Shewanella sp. phage 1/4]AHK11311.1 transglycosylase [Shewanella sp. phage 1/4]